MARRFRPKKRPSRRMLRKPRASRSRVSKPLRAAIKQVVKTEVETKTINVPDPDSGLVPKNTINKAYLSASGLQYLAQDIFKCSQGVQDSTAVVGAGNRIGDKVRGVGFLMNYYFHPRTGYTISGLKLLVPYIKLRIIVFRQAFGQPIPSYGTLYNTDFCNNETWTLQPVDFHEGYVKDVLYDKVHILKPHQSFPVDNVSDPNTQQAQSNCFHFKKYIKFDHPIKYMDSQFGNPNGTDKPLHIAISAEIDDSWTAGGFPPSDTPLIYTTGYTQAWFKDA